MYCRPQLLVSKEMGFSLGCQFYFFTKINLDSNGYLVASLQRFYMVKPCPKEMRCDVEVRF